MINFLSTKKCNIFYHCLILSIMTTHPIYLSKIIYHKLTCLYFALMLLYNSPRRCIIYLEDRDTFPLLVSLFPNISHYLHPSLKNAHCIFIRSFPSTLNQGRISSARHFKALLCLSASHFLPKCNLSSAYSSVTIFLNFPFSNYLISPSPNIFIYLCLFFFK